MFARRKAQSFMDYAALIAIISISLLAITGYLFKAVRARMHHVKADLSDPVNGVR